MGRGSRDNATFNISELSPSPSLEEKMGLGIVRVTREFIYNAIKEKSTNLPKDAVLGGIGYDIDRACIYVIIEHPSIESVPQGEVLPTVTPILGWDE